MQDTNIQLTLRTEEVNLILNGLGSMPFNQVFQIIGKIQQQSQHQLQSTQLSPAPVSGGNK